MNIGMKIYYELATGNVILNTGERSGDVVTTTCEQDFAAYQVLNERVPETIGVIKLEYRQHSEDFMHATGYRVNLETEELEFSFEPINPEQHTEPVYQKPLTEQIATLQQRTEANEAAILALLDFGL